MNTEYDLDQLYTDIHTAATAIHQAALETADEHSLMAAVELSLADLPRETFGLIIADLSLEVLRARRARPETTA